MTDLPVAIGSVIKPIGQEATYHLVRYAFETPNLLWVNAYTGYRHTPTEILEAFPNFEVLYNPDTLTDATWTMAVTQSDDGRRLVTFGPKDSMLVAMDSENFDLVIENYLESKMKQSGE